jgi:hypothetical protein
MRLSRIRGKNSLELTVTNENSAAKTALLRLFQFESREKPQSLLALIGMGTLPIMDGWFDQFMPSGVAPGPTGAIDVAAIGGTGTNPLLGPSALTPATTSGASTSQSFESTTHAGSMWSLSPFGDPPGYGGLASLGRDLGGDPASFALTNSGGGQLPGSVDSGSTFTNSNVTSPATTRSSSGTPTTSEPAISTLPPTKGSQPLSTTVTNAVAAAPQSGGGTLMLAGPATDFITPPQRLAPGPNTTFTREFVVELKPGV